MNLHAFYHLEHIGDVLLVRLTHERQVTKYEKIDQLCVLYHDDQIIGYNVFEASHFFHSLTNGKVKMTPEFIKEFNDLLTQYHLPLVESDYDDHIKVGHVMKIEEHPDSDHMHICQVDVGHKVLQIVCGAPNVALDQYVVVAMIDAVMPNGLIIRPSQLRGIKSDGMLCSPRELGLANAPLKRGILILDKEQYQIGDSFFK